MKGIRYILKKASVEVKARDFAKIEEGITQTYKDDIFSDTVAIIEDRVGALGELNAIKSTCWHFTGYYLVTEYYIVEEIYNEKYEEWEECDIVEFARFEGVK